jgi:signal transduction histidine kinase
MSLTDLVWWFSGGPPSHHGGGYMTLIHCMNEDWLWIGITVALDMLVAAGYCLIAWHWQSNQKRLPPSPAKRALGNMRNIFVFCGLCGYAFIPIKMVWPAWRLYDMFMLVLVYFTWRYAWGARDLKVVYSELTRTRKLEADLRESREESQRKSLFLNALSHDLRTPLNGMVLQSQVAEVSIEGGDADTARTALKEIHASAQAAAALLDNLLEIGRLDWTEDPNHSETMVVREVLEAVARKLRPEAQRKGLDLRVTAPDDLRLTADRLKLERVLTNLAHNAIKFTSTGRVELGADQADDSVRVWVEDTGEGIPEEHHEHLFQEFYQVCNRERDRKKGFGLGLSIAQRLVRQLGGSIELRSAVGRGSRFTVVLPNAVGEEKQTSATNRHDRADFATAHPRG